jgi:hypothetical protein
MEAGWLFNGDRTCASSAEPSLQAQPAPWLYFVSLIIFDDASCSSRTVCPNGPALG